jgi:hypothetical protein
MQPQDRVVIQIPLAELWDTTGTLPAARGRSLSREEVRQLVQAGAVRFVVADAGLPLRWVPDAERHVFWKGEVRRHLVEEPERPFDIYQSPEGYAYIATAWESGDPASPPIILLERHH